MLIGITHDTNKQPIIKAVKSVKVGIGIPKGRASIIFIKEGKWNIRYGFFEDNKLTMKTVLVCNTRAEAEAYHAANKHTAAVSNRPQKIPFFTFTKRSIVEENGKPVELFEPDFAAIEAHGEMPREIDIVLMSEQPYSGEYQMWSASELKCHGDGIQGQRVLSMGNEQWPGWAEAKAASARFFPVESCFTNGCPYAADGQGCKPGVDLHFQLSNSMRLGSTAYFHSTSIRSAAQLFSSVETIRQMAERAGSSLIGLPLKLVLAPFKTNYKGQTATQYGASLELRADDMNALRQKLLEAAWSPRQIAAGSMVVEEPSEISTSDISAPGIAAEFYDGETEFDDETTDGPAPAPAAASAARETEVKTSALAEKLKKKKDGNTPAPVEINLGAPGAQPATAATATPAAATAAPATQPTTQQEGDLF